MAIYHRQSKRGRPKGKTGKAAILKPDELKRLLKLVSVGQFAERDQTILTLSYGLGLRAKELASLKWGDVFDDRAQIKDSLHLKPSYTKKAKSRDVYLTSLHVRKRLQQFFTTCVKFKPNDPLFVTRTRKPFTANGIAKRMNHLHKQAGFNQASSHSGRRTMITHLAEQGVDLKSIATLAGHSSIATTARYVQDNPVRLAKIMERVTW